MGSAKKRVRPIRSCFCRIVKISGKKISSETRMQRQKRIRPTRWPRTIVLAGSSNCGQNSDEVPHFRKPPPITGEGAYSSQPITLSNNSFSKRLARLLPQIRCCLPLDMP